MGLRLFVSLIPDFEAKPPDIVQEFAHWYPSENRREFIIK
jgi:hypothetical protein